MRRDAIATTAGHILHLNSIGCVVISHMIRNALHPYRSGGRLRGLGGSHGAMIADTGSKIGSRFHLDGVSRFRGSHGFVEVFMDFIRPGLDDAGVSSGCR